MTQENQLYKKCRKELEEIDNRWQQHAPSDTRTLIGDDYVLHYFVPEIHWKAGLDKPHAAAFGQPGLSVRAEGGSFGQITKRQLALEMQQLSADTGIPFIGAVRFESKDILEHNKFLNFRLVHDPHPFMKDGKPKEQAANHVQIVCDKRNVEKLDLLVSLCNWSLHPTEVETALSPELCDEQTNTEHTKSAKDSRWLILLLILLGFAVLFLLINRPH